MDKPVKIKPAWRPRIAEWLREIHPGETHQFPAECLPESIRRVAVRLGMKISMHRMPDGAWEVTRKKPSVVEEGMGRIYDSRHKKLFNEWEQEL